MGISATKAGILEQRNQTIYQALQDGSDMGKLASQFRLSERTVRDINRRMTDRYAGANGKRPPAFGEMGLTGLKQSWGYIYEEFLSELNSPAKRYKIFNEMRHNSPVAAALLLAIELSVRRVEWHIEGDEDDERVEFIEGARNDTSHSWNDHISEALTMLPFGFSAFEIVYKRRQGDAGETSSRFNDGKIGWRKFAFRSQDSLYRWQFDENGGLMGFDQQAWNDYKIRPIPIEKMVLYRTTTEKGNPEGRSILRPGYVPYYYAKNLQAIEAIGAERDLAGLPMIKMPEGADTSAGSTDLENAEKIVRRVRNDEQAGAVIPPGWEFSLLSSPGSKQVKVGEIIERYNKQIALSALAQFLLLGMDQVGSYSLSKDHSDFFLMAVGAFADIIAETFNTYAIPRLLKLNGMDVTAAPQLVHGQLGAPDIQQIADFIQKVAGPGFIQPDDEIEKWLRGLVNAPELTDETIQAREEREAKSSKPEPGQPGQQPIQDGAPLPDGQMMDEMLKTMSIKQQVARFSASANGVRAAIKQMPDDRTRKAILSGSKRLSAVNQNIMKAKLAALKAITDEEWQRAVDADAHKERIQGP